LIPDLWGEDRAKDTVLTTLDHVTGSPVKTVEAKLYTTVANAEVHTAGVQVIEHEGSECYLVNMLYVLRQLFGTGVSRSKDYEED